MSHSSVGRPAPDTARRLAETPIAIVGLAGLYPKSRSMREFWRNIVSGADCIEDVPETHWNTADYYDGDPAAEDKTYSRRGGFIPETSFNPMEFGLPPNTLEVTDILQLLSLAVARDVLRDARTQGSTWYDPRRTGVVLGVTGANSLTQPLSARLQTPVLKEVVRSCGLSEQEAEEIAERFKKAYIPWEENSFPGMLGNVVAGRIANRFDLGGTNCTVDAACASSLAAVKLAVSELLEGRADMMITGGCDAENTILMYMCFSKTPAFSKSQRIRPFDESADGTLIGEGIGMLAMKRLADAERDGDRIYAVLKGIGSSSDGRFKSIYAPRAEGQELALRRAYDDADVSPHSVELFEAHGTGTSVGDQTELTALTKVVAGGTDDHGFAAIGSVKSQIGHTKAAAGAAGLIKLALALHQKVLPPTINVEKPSSAVDPAATPFYVNTQAKPWIKDPARPKRRAALSSFGFGGTNFHMVLEEHGSEEAPKVLGPAARTGVWHAADAEALAARLESGADAGPTGPIPAGDARVGIAARTEEEFAELRRTAAAQLRARPDAEAWQHPKGIVYRRHGLPSEAKVAAVFAGQGSQYVGMGREAALALPPVREAFERAGRCAGPGGGSPGRAVFPPPAFTDAERDRQEETLRRTDVAQPAIGALSAGQYRWFTGLGLTIDGAIGHSFGELTALWAAGALDDEQFHTLAQARGAAMAPPAGAAADFDPGTMAAVFAELDDVRQLIAGSGCETVSVCNINAPGQIVVGGSVAEVEQLVKAARDRGIRARRLPVSAAFHTRFVAHAADAFRRSVDRAGGVRAPGVPVYANTPGASYGTDPAANSRTLVEQLLQPVDFAARIEEMYADGFRVFVEFGPKRVLTDLVGTILQDRTDVVRIAVDGGPGKDGELAAKRAAVELAVLGLPVRDIDGWTEPEPEAPVRKGMSIPLRGVNYVSDARKSAYREALSTPLESLVARATAAATVAEGEAVEPASADAVREGLRLQGEILDGHLETMRQTVRQLEQTVSAGGDPDVDAAVRLIREQGATIAEAHDRATRLLIDVLRQEDGSARQEERQEPVAVVEPAPAPVTESEPVAAASESAPAGAASSAVLGVLMEVVAEKTGYPAEMLEPGMDLEADLGIDSIKRVQILGALQERFPEVGSVEPEGVGELRTLGDIAEFLGSVGTPAAVVEQAAAPAQVESAPVIESASAGAASSAVLEVLMEVVAEKTGYPAEMLEPGMDLEADLGIDSIKRVQILGALQERFPEVGSVEPEGVGELRTLGDIAEFLGSVGTPAAVVEPEPVAAAFESESVAVASEPAPAGAASAAVLDVLMEVVAEKTGYPAEMLEPGMDLEADLGIDSIKRVQILGALQERFPEVGSVEPEGVGELRTLGDIAGFLGSVGTPAAVVEQAAAPAQVESAPVIESASAGAASSAVLDVLMEVVAEKTGYPAEMLEPGMDLEADLGIDSIKRVQILGALQERFPEVGSVEPEGVGELRTLGDIAEFLGSVGTPAEQTAAAVEQSSVPAATHARPDAPLTVSYPPAPGIGRTFAVLSELPVPDVVVGAYAERPGALVVDDGSALVRPIVAALRAAGWRVDVIALPDEVYSSVEADSLRTLNSWEPAELTRAVAEVRATARRVDLVVQLAAAAVHDWDAACRRLTHALLVAKETQGALTEASATGRAAFVAVTQLDGANGHRGSSGAAPLLGGVSGLVKTLAVEAPKVFCRTVDFAPGLADDVVGDRFLAEISDLSTAEREVGIDGTGRRTVALTDRAPELGETLVGPVAAPELTASDLLVVTGGARGVTAQCLRALAAVRPTGLLLLGRSPVTEEPGWAQGLDGAALKAAVAQQMGARGEKPTPRGVEAVYREITGSREIAENVRELRELGADVTYLPVDITDGPALRAALAPYADRVTGVVHGAGVLADRLIAEKTAAEAEKVLGTKLIGLRNVLYALRGAALRHVVLFSSVAGFFGNRGQSDYAIANEALNRVAARLRGELPGARVTSVNWGAWDGGMVDDDLRRMFASRGVVLLPPATGAGMFAEQFTAARGADSVIVVGPTTPLSAPDAGDAAVRPSFVVDRVLAPLAGDRLLADHAIGGRPVLPATAALGALVHTVEAATGRPVTAIRSFRVFKGVVLDEEAPQRLRISAEPARTTPGTGQAVDAMVTAIDRSGRSRPAYAGVLDVTAGPGPRPAPRTDLAELARTRAGSDAAGLYTDGTLFHGPTLRGIRRVVLAEPERLVVGCRLADPRPAAGAYDGELHSPVLADLLLQSALVWVRRFRQAASLPLEIASVRYFAPLPADEEFLVALEDVRTAPGGVVCTLTACDRDGQVLQVFEGVTVVEDQELEAKFRQAARLGAPVA